MIYEVWMRSPEIYYFCLCPLTWNHSIPIWVKVLSEEASVHHFNMIISPVQGCNISTIQDCEPSPEEDKISGDGF